MPIGIQELAALAIVGCVVCFALYRRWRRRRDAAASCDGCGKGAGNAIAEQPAEKKIHFYRRQD